jgi:hypothetical protein
MKNLLIIYPHWPPSNLAGIHRPRLIANYIHQFGWHPIVITVKPEYYEEPLDENMNLLVSDKIEVHSVDARSINKGLRIIGDIGLRGWSQIKKKALEIIKKREIDFIWIPIPSFYMAVMGRRLNSATGVPYGIDYIDPWVRDISGRRNWRSVLSVKIAEALEPYAVKYASLITGVSEGYFTPVYDRNPEIKDIPNLAFPYGFDPNDHQVKIDRVPLPFRISDEIEDNNYLIYAGAFLPNSRKFLKILFEQIAQLRLADKWKSGLKLVFIGTSYYAGKTIAEHAKIAGIEDIVLEERERHPFLHILQWLSRSKAVMVIGSTEEHYTASKTYQAILSNKPIFAVTHRQSSAFTAFSDTNTAQYTVPYSPTMTDTALSENIRLKLQQTLFADNWQPNLKGLEKYNSKHYAKLLAEKLDEVTS